MSRQIVIDPVTRIEGHARVVIDIDDRNNVVQSIFKVMDFRGFESILRGMQVEMMPTLTPRICGTCPHTHHLAAARAVDHVFGVKPTRTAKLIRQVMNLGAMIHSHAVHFFALAGPDFFMGLNSDPAKRNIMGMVEKYPDISKSALHLRSIGQRIAELTGGRGIHPVTSVAGGVAAPLSAEQGDMLKKLVAEGLTLGRKLYAVAKKVLARDENLIQSLPLETNYMGTVVDGVLDFYEGKLRHKRPDGSFSEFAEENWTDHLKELALPESYGKSVHFKEDDAPVRVGPLARLNCADKMGTPLADAELEEFRSLYGNPCHHTVMYHHARMIELLYCFETLDQMVKDDELYGDNIKAQVGTPGNACAHVEAPRGVLIHDYEVDQNAIVTRANLLVATQQNLIAINDTISLSAQKYMDKPDADLLNAIEFGIRCYDPCLSCATHRVGEMKLRVDIRQKGKTIRSMRR